MKKTLVFTVFIVILVLLFPYSLKTTQVKADALTDEIDKQLDNIQLEELEEFFNNLETLPENINFLEVFNKLLKGDNNLNFNGIKDYIVKTFFVGVKRSLPPLLGVVAISVFCLIMRSGKSDFNSVGASTMVFWVCAMSVFLIMFSEIIKIYSITKNTIKTLTNLIEIMSPIMISLILSCGGKVSATLYSPAMVFLSNFVAEIFTSVILPLTCVVMFLSFLGNISQNIKVEKIIDFINSLIKWIIGITLTVFTVYISIRGISAGSYDGISLRITKYTLANSLPLVGGFVSGSLDLVLAGSVIIKNAVGLTCVFALFYVLISPILQILSFLLCLKFVAGIIDIYSDTKIPQTCSIVSKGVSNFIAVILGVGITFVITVLLMVLSVGAFF